jgi:8-oxo-dGTP pyrophosphatase MutT (NUDIX family)
MITNMAEAIIFGDSSPSTQYVERRAAYLVVINGGRVAMVKSRQKHFLPGGGSLPGESPEDTVVREVREELARGVRLFRRLGEAVQYFYSSTDDRSFKMLATFLEGDFTDEGGGDAGEHELDWLPLTGIEQSCFHECHAWAIHQAAGIQA